PRLLAYPDAHAPGHGLRALLADDRLDPARRRRHPAAGRPGWQNLRQRRTPHRGASHTQASPPQQLTPARPGLSESTVDSAASGRHRPATEKTEGTSRIPPHATSTRCDPGPGHRDPASALPWFNLLPSGLASFTA